MEPAKLTKLMRGELDWIVMKTLEKDRNRRYETANGLAMDVQRYLNDEPVLACPPSTWYRLRKFARRNKGILLTVGFAVTALVLATVVSAWQAIRATEAQALAHQRLEAEKEARKKSVANLKKARDAVDQMLTAVGERELAAVPHMESVRRALLEKALRFYQGFLQEDSDDRTLRLETAKAWQRVATIHRQLGRPDQAEKAFREAIGLLEQLVAESPSEPDCRAALAETYHLLAIGLTFDLGRHAEAQTVLRRALTLREELATEYPNVGDYRSGRAGTLDLLAVTYTHTGQQQKAEEGHRQALALAEKVVADFPKVPEYRRQKAYILWGLAGVLPKHPQEAERYYREALQSFLAVPNADTPFDVSNTYFCLGNLLWASARPEKAEDAYRQALMLTEKLVADFPASASYLQHHASLTLQFGRFLAAEKRPQEAEAAYRRVLDIQEKLIRNEKSVLLSGHQILISSQNELVALLKSDGRHQEAEKVCRRAVDFFEKLATDHRSVSEYQRELATARKNLNAFLEKRK
jgi:eukaryotic-like serine/threonine-protein kinase